MSTNTRTNKGAPRAPRLSSEQVAAGNKAERARKAASKAALKSASAHIEPPAPDVVLTQQLPAADAHVAERKLALANAAFEEAQRVDFEAELAAGNIPVGTTFAEYLADVTAPAAEKGRYTGPMLALVAARRHYVKGANGNPHSNDGLAQILEVLTRAEVCTVLVQALNLPGNPYLALNPGQQSMNLRNKARGAQVKGTLNVAALRAAVEAAVAARAA